MNELSRENGYLVLYEYFIDFTFEALSLIFLWNANKFFFTVRPTNIYMKKIFDWQNFSFDVLNAFWYSHASSNLFLLWKHLAASHRSIQSRISLLLCNQTLYARDLFSRKRREAFVCIFETLAFKSNDQIRRPNFEVTCELKWTSMFFFFK